MSTILSFKSIENKHDVSRGKDCKKRFCETLTEHTMEIINFKKKFINKLTAESYQNAKICYICKTLKKLKINVLKIENIIKLERIVIIQVNIGVLHIAYVI